jgi:hypothetical protein
MQAAAGIQHGSHLSGVSGLFARLFAHATTGQTARAFSQQAAGSGEAAAAAAAAEPSSSNAEGDGAEDAAGPSQADLQALLFSRDEEINQLKGQVSAMTYSSSSSTAHHLPAHRCGPADKQLHALPIPMSSRHTGAVVGLWLHAGLVCLQLNDLTDAYKRNLAEMENLRERTRREIDTAKKFAIQVSMAVGHGESAARAWPLTAQAG